MRALGFAFEHRAGAINSFDDNWDDVAGHFILWA